MPELPEVETTKRGITPHLVDRTIHKAIVYQPKLRQIIPHNFSVLLHGQRILDVGRRSKYLLIRIESGTVIIHLGMSGHLRIDPPNTPLKKHDHVEIYLDNLNIVRYNDPRRFGLWLHTHESPLSHPLLEKLGPEPFDVSFSGGYLLRLSQGKRQAIKSFIMNNHIVVGVGNIYATESLYLSKINPQTPAGLLSEEQFHQLSLNIRHVLKSAIEAGGTTLKDFFATDGSPGYFAINLKIYGRQGKACYECNTKIQGVKISGRQSTFCPKCQPFMTG